MVTTVLLAAILGALGVIAWKLWSKPTTSSEREQKLQFEIGECKEKLRAAESHRDELSGKGKSLHAAMTKLEAEHKSLLRERDELRDDVTRSKAEKKKMDEEFKRSVQELTASKKGFDDERARVIREDEAERERELAERDRMWAEHETSVIAKLTDLCKQPQFAFSAFSNVNLPEGFDGSLKPDFLIDFLGQYVIFDAKVSKAESLQTYINDTVKRTAEKLKKNSKIFPMVFLVVPTKAITELSKTYYPKDDYYFYVVSPESLPPILSSLKRLTGYERFEQFDPEQREAIVNLMADLDYHIQWRAAMDIAMIRNGIDVTQKIQKLAPDIVSQVMQRKAEKKPPIPTTSELKRIIGDTTLQTQELQELVEPTAPVNKKHVKMAESLLGQSLL